MFWHGIPVSESSMYAFYNHLVSLNGNWKSTLVSITTLGHKKWQFWQETILKKYEKLDPSFTLKVAFLEFQRFHWVTSSDANLLTNASCKCSALNTSIAQCRPMKSLELWTHLDSHSKELKHNSYSTRDKPLSSNHTTLNIDTFMHTLSPIYIIQHPPPSCTTLPQILSTSYHT